ncbi:MAG TPA: LytTR family DNA-binding domain-containing protein [Bacteroidales bacterium]|nr:LytTR family DNA-binding domain-containing protein [Bacteroidales bacterium]HPS15826.1 LytTR family DNA-binding domain-containing protein [Bacteroidales bacterium]
MDKIRTIIIDDEKTSRETLLGLLKRYCKNVEVVAEADGYRNGIEVIHKFKPDVVFLDIQMPDGSGFKMLEDIGEINFEVIFSTAYDQFAIKAIKYSALDYLLKPINPEDLINSIEKLETKLTKGKDNTNVKFLIDTVKSPNLNTKKIVLSTSEGMHIVDIDNIIRCESEDYYTKFFFKDGKTIMVSRTLKENEELLSEFNFIRPHKSHLINLKYVKSFLKIDGGSIVMTDGSYVPVSRRKREQILDIINHL